MRLKNLFRIFALSTVITLSATTQAQDLIARQAPVDRKSKVVDTVVIVSQRQILAEREASEYPSSDLYPTWENNYAHKPSPMPDTYKIDLRGFHMPTPSRVVTSNFGPRWGRMHKGLDIKVYIGDTIRAAFSGKVRVVKYDANGYGKYVVIRHNNGLETIYGHMSAQLVQPNQNVVAGQPIGLGGNTGRSTGSHLHFETRLCGEALNPALMFDFKHQDVVGDFYVYRKSTYQSESLQATRLRGKNADGGYTRQDVTGTMN
ncbi:MAG: M23 family metallopeptidase [Prevotella sp.]|jgi:murein DD-endopeptidase MepM/ murein hydrolase activator NlpD|nr:M23 family metallopeptidase [Prevotella sp.]